MDSIYPVQDEGVQIGHVALRRHGSLVVVLEMFLQLRALMWNLQHRVQVVRQDLHGAERIQNSAIKNAHCHKDAVQKP